RLCFWNLVNTHIKRGRNDMADLLDWLIENDFIEATSDFFPLPLRGLVEMVSVGVETLVKQANDKQWFVCAPRRSFRDTLQDEYVLSMRIERGELKKLPQLVNDQ